MPVVVETIRTVVCVPVRECGEITVRMVLMDAPVGQDGAAVRAAETHARCHGWDVTGSMLVMNIQQITTSSVHTTCHTSAKSLG